MKRIFTNSVYYLCVCCMAILLPFGLTSCATDDELAEYKESNDGGIKSFTSFIATLDDVAGTRAYLDAEASDGIRRVHWNLSDVIYVYSDTDTELKKYEMTSLSEDDQAVFSGEEVTGNKFYAVYARNREITVDEDNYNIMHFSKAGMTSTYGFHGPLVATTTGNALNFKQIIGIIHVTVGNINMIDRVSFSGNSNEIIGGKGYVDMSESHPVLRLDDDASTISYSQIFNDSFDDKYTDLYICIPPTIFEDGFSVRITGKDSNDKEFAIEKNFNSRFEVKSGTISRFSLVDISAELEAQGSDEIIVFADPVVKQICVENWDTNGDGELSYGEAAAVTDIGQVFEDNTDIVSFNEFQYFTGLKSIGELSFYYCSSLTSIDIPIGVELIGNQAFDGCSSLTSIVIPEGVMSIGWSAFSYCSSLTSIEVDKNNLYYDSRDDCNAIIETNSNTLIAGCASTVIPASVTSIGDYVFSDCNLTSIVIPESVTSIGTAFYNCNSLTSIVIPKDVTSIGDAAFAYCSSLTSIEVDKNNLYYDSRDDCNAIIETNSNTLIAGCASTIIPASVTSIGGHAFSGRNLTSIVIPEGVTSIGNRAFHNCRSLTGIVIPEGVTSIGEGAFQYCRSLTSIVIPEGVTSIGDAAFYRCSSLISFTCLASNPPVLEYNITFYGTNVTIYVPAASVEAYKAADGWKEYASQIQAILE